MARILIVEDDGDIAELLTVMLENIGMEVRSAQRGAEALTVLQDFKAEAVITDLNMPGMDGLGLCMALRSSAEFSQVPVLIYSAVHGNDPRLVEAQALGRVEVATKPLGWTALTGRVRGLLEQGK